MSERITGCGTTDGEYIDIQPVEYKRGHRYYALVKRIAELEQACASCYDAQQRGEEYIAELQATIKAVKAEIESERANTKRVGIGNVIHNILDNIETALDSGGG